MKLMLDDGSRRIYYPSMMRLRLFGDLIYLLENEILQFHIEKVVRLFLGAICCLVVFAASVI